MRLPRTLLCLIALWSCFSLSAQDKYAGNYNVLLRSTAFVPPSNLEAVLKDGQVFSGPVATTTGYTYKGFQFHAIPNRAARTAMEAQGLVFLEYLPHNTYLVAIPNGFDAQLLTSMNVRSVFDFTPAMKTPTALSAPHPTYAVEGNFLKVSLTYPKVMEEATFLALLRSAVGSVQVVYAHPTSANLECWINQQSIDALLSLPYVLWAEYGAPPGEPESDLGRTLHRASMLDQEFMSGRHYDGTGVSVAVNDDGFVGPHIDFNGRTEQSTVAADLDGDHGDMVLGILGGAGNLDPTTRGMATGAFMHVRAYNGNLPNTVTLHQNDDVVIFSSSYGGGCNAGYNAVTRNVDVEIGDNPAIVQVFSTGNSGTLDCGYGAGTGWGNITGGHKTAKNAISTANLFSDDSRANSSSRGPATDGRLKPDIAAHGQGQISTDPNNTYAPGGGTSAAAPGISGVLAQLYQAYKEMNNDQNPPSGLIKACLLNSAEDLGRPGPDFEFGWGRVNAFRAVTVLEDDRWMDDEVGQGGNNAHTINVPAGVNQLKVMLYWMDPAGSTNAQFALVNDLELTVEDPGANIRLPLILDPSPNVTALTTTAFPGVDNLNNMEQVVVTNPVPGTYTVEVDGASVPMGPQEYFIVYEFHTDEVNVIYPNGGEGIDPDQNERIRWDATDNLGPFTLEYSTDGGNAWTQIATNINGDLREFDWDVPNTMSGEALIRVSRGQEMDESDAEFSIIKTPLDLKVDWTCADSIQFSWDPVIGATEYEVFLMGDMYMEPVDITSETTLVITGLSVLEEDWLSVRAFGPNGAQGRRAVAISKPLGIDNCSLPTDVHLSNILNPAFGTVPGCFDYSNVSVKVLLINNGYEPISDVPVNYSIDGGTAVSEIYPGPLAPGASVEYSFSVQEDLSAPGLYSLTAWTLLSGDGNPYNDRVSQQMNREANFSSVTLPYYEDFEGFNRCAPQPFCEIISCNFPSETGWINEQNQVLDAIDFRVNAGGTATDDTGPTMDLNPGTATGKYVYLEASDCFGREGLMLTPCIDLSQNKWPHINFWYHMYGINMGELHLDVLTEDGYELDIMDPIVGNQEDVWREHRVLLEKWIGQTIVLRFRGITGPEWRSDLAIDNISMEDGQGTSTPENLTELQDFNLYPNPTRNSTTLRIDMGEAAGEVAVMNSLSQQMGAFQLTSGANTIEIPSADYPQGIYFVVARNASGEVMAVRKLIKE